MSTTRTETQVVVIGAGQAGLAVAYYLRRFQLTPGVDFVVYDRGPRTGGAWQHRWDALKLGSAHHVNDLPGMGELGLSFETADRSLPARDIVAGYYRRYEEHFGLEVQRPVAVRSVYDRGADLIVEHSAGETATRLVVNASGTWGAPFIPYYPGMNDFAGRHVHTSGYVAAQDFAGQSVVVVGGGTSAIGFLLELEGVAESLTWATRRPVDFRDESELTIEGGVAAVTMQDAAARAGEALPSIVSGTGVPRTRRIAAGIERGVLTERPMFAQIEEHGVRWPDGSFSRADAIVWATGFRPELRHLSPLRLREKTGGLTVASGASWQDSRIFLAGYGPQASTIGANRAGRIIARQIMAQL
ncbi:MULTISPECIES: NAD(P)-binding domain-containing protein [unclassified Leifsonia]|uniref:NAD(P)-binding domain-containing protein n=1 Tax=unclassified Leifsonia TaxID=2663824 RepID=UPI0008A7C0F0|nr:MULTISPECIES: NAD(P)-binding domain-containing protein [unclassified Leifsonia]SEI11956.1 putative flavoprotein involved in K+ transport [Leifsonia sp. CL154]SFL94530.1 putative flavoprotein involved in K+ transport [Leifsonia sp. CL147]